MDLGFMLNYNPRNFDHVELMLNRRLLLHCTITYLVILFRILYLKINIWRPHRNSKAWEWQGRDIKVAIIEGKLLNLEVKESPDSVTAVMRL